MQRYHKNVLRSSAVDCMYVNLPPPSPPDAIDLCQSTMEQDTKRTPNKHSCICVPTVLRVCPLACYHQIVPGGIGVEGPQRSLRVVSCRGHSRCTETGQHVAWWWVIQFFICLAVGHVGSVLELKYMCLE
jgi:hypothetical protein